MTILHRHRRWRLVLSVAALASALTASSPAARQAAVSPATSEQLIDRALAARQIDEETAHKYRVFAAFSDARLPAQFSGADGQSEELPASVAVAGQLLPTFSAQTRADLAPFFMRPSEPGSWVSRAAAEAEPTSAATAGQELSPDGSTSGPSVESSMQTAIAWQTVPAAGGKVKVWAQTRYQNDYQTAKDVAAAITSKIWPDLVALFWEPLPDDERPMAGGGGMIPIFGDNGGDKALDVYLIHIPNFKDKGYALPADKAAPCGQSPRYLTIESRRPLGGPTSPGILQTVVHELTHAITHAKPWLDDRCSEFRWIDEATGKWSEDYVYPRSQSEQDKAMAYLNDTQRPLNFEFVPENDRHYGVYLFPFHLRHHGLEPAIPAMWEQFRGKKSLAGIDAALSAAGQSLEKVFPKFAVDNWNRDSANTYTRVDSLTKHASAPDGEDPEEVAGSIDKKIPLDIPYLAAQYRHFKFGAAVRSVTFTNALKADPRAAVWVIEQIKGQWKPPRDVSDELGLTWCRDLPAEDLGEVVLIFSNKTWPKTPAQENNLTGLIVRHTPELKAFRTGCNAWIGTTKAVGERRTDWTLNETAVSTVRFEPNDELNRPGRPPRYWRAVSGSISWDVLAKGSCTGTSSGTIPIAIDNGNLPATLQIWDAGDPFTPPAPRKLRYSGSVGAIPDQHTPSFTFTCGGDYKYTTTLMLVSAWFEADPDGHLITEGTTTLSGTYDMPGLPAGSSLRWTWTLRSGP